MSASMASAAYVYTKGIGEMRRNVSRKFGRAKLRNHSFTLRKCKKEARKCVFKFGWKGFVISQIA